MDQNLQTSTAYVTELAVRANQGDKASLTELIELFDPLLTKYAGRFSGELEFNDAYQEGCLLLVRIVKEKKVSEMNNFPGYFKKSLKAHLVHLSQKDSRQDEIADRLIEKGLVDTVVEAYEFSGEEKETSFEDVKNVLRRLLFGEELSQDQKIVLVLRILGYKNKECAQIQKISPPLLTYRMKKIRETFHKIVDGDSRPNRGSQMDQMTSEKKDSGLKINEMVNNAKNAFGDLISDSQFSQLIQIIRSWLQMSATFLDHPQSSRVHKDGDSPAHPDLMGVR